MTFHLIEQDLAEAVFRGEDEKVVPAELDEIAEVETVVALYQEAGSAQVYRIVEGTGENIRWGVYQAMEWDDEDNGQEKFLIWGDPILIEEGNWGAGTLKRTMALEPMSRPKLFKVRPENRSTERAPSTFVLRRAETPEAMQEQWWSLVAEKRLEPAAAQMVVTFDRSVEGIKNKSAFFEWWAESGALIGKWIAACTFRPAFTNVGRPIIEMGLVKGYEEVTLDMVRRVVRDLIQGVEVVGGFKIEERNSQLFPD